MIAKSIVSGSAPDAIALAASPASIVFDGSATATVTAKVTDATGNNVADGTPVTFNVVEATGSANPVRVGTVFGLASSTITPSVATAESLTVEVSSGAASCTIRVDRRGTIADLFKRSAWRVLGDLLEPPFVPHQQKEIARSLKLPEASVQRGLRTLVDAGLVQRKRSQYVVSVGQDAIRYFWLLRQAERYSALPPGLANAMSVLLAREFSRDDCVIMFGSWARGVAIPGESDVDVGVFTAQGGRVGSRRLFEGPYRVETQTWDMEELRRPGNSAALDALVNGIALTRRDDVYDALLGLRSFPKSFLLYRLEQANRMLLRAELGGGDSEAATFFSAVAQRIVGQVRNILVHGRTMSWRETPRAESLRSAIADLGERLAREGDEIWLT
jgi:hypothetical protein